MAMRDLIPWGRQQNSAPAMWRNEESNPLASFRREVDRLFDDFFRAPVFGTPASSMMTSWPSIEVSDGDRELLVTAELPGMTDKDVELLVDNGVLTIRGEKKGQRDERDYSERWYGRFERQIPLPASVKEDGCRADFSDGVLTIHLPKSPEAADLKRIPINGETRH